MSEYDLKSSSLAMAIKTGNYSEHDLSKNKIKTIPFA